MSDPAAQVAESTEPAWPRIARRIRVPVGFAFAIVYVWLARPTANSVIIGALVVVAGLALRGAASGHVRKNEQLATSGPYAYTRNPLYLGSLLLAGGFALAARSWWIVGIMIVMFTVIYIPVIGSEEGYLRRTFPEFDEYARHVPRLLPRLTPHRSSDAAFSPELYWKHREYQAGLGSLGVLAILILKLVW